MIKPAIFPQFFGIYFAAEHGGDSVSGGGHPDEKSISAEEAINEGTGQPFAGHGRVPGTADPGEPGSRTNPVHGKKERESDEPLGRPTGEGSGAGS